MEIRKSRYERFSSLINKSGDSEFTEDETKSITFLSSLFLSVPGSNDGWKKIAVFL
jgi:hypothetical protein